VAEIFKREVGVDPRMYFRNNPKTKHCTFSLKISKKNEVFRVVKWLYGQGGESLSRKYSRALELLALEDSQ